MRLEQEKNWLQTELALMKRKFSNFFLVIGPFFVCLVEYVVPCSLLGDHEVVVNRVAELEGILKSESAKSKQLLDQAEQCGIELMQAKKTEVARLLSLAAHVGGKLVDFVYLSARFIVLLLLLVKLTQLACFCRNLRRYSSTRKHL